MKRLAFLSFALFALFVATAANGAELLVGAASVDMTPPKSVPLRGQMHLRLSQGVKSPITANVCAVEALEDGEPTDAAIFVSLDAVAVPDDFGQIIRDKAVAQDSTINPDKIVLFGTHTHTSAHLGNDGPELPKGDNIATYEETTEFMTSKIAEAIAAAWKARVPADFSWGLEQVSIGWSRRACYFDGSAQMYGNPNTPNFSHYENPSDPDLGSVFFWNKDGALISIIVDVACTAQVVEGLNVFCADYWRPTRVNLQKRFGENVVIVGAISPAGDDSPHPQYRGAALQRMRNLRGLDEMEEIARKIDRAVADSYECAVKDKSAHPTFVHLSRKIELEPRIITEAEYNDAKAQAEAVEQRVRDNPDKTLAEIAYSDYSWHKKVVDRYEETQKSGEAALFPTTIRAIRIGNLVIATNQFELFVDFGTRIKARSPSVGTFLIQLAGPGTYLPTEKAVKGGGYSAVIQSNPVGPQGGQTLVEETLKLIGEVWE